MGVDRIGAGVYNVRERLICNTLDKPLLTLIRQELKVVFEKLKMSTSTVQKSLAEEKNTLVFLRVKAWKENQRLFMPGLSLPETDLIEHSITNGEILNVLKIPLRLASDLEMDARESVCTKELIQCEIELWKGQMELALEDLMKILQKEFTLARKNKQQVYSQSQNSSTRLGTNAANLHVAKEEMRLKYMSAGPRKLVYIQLRQNGQIWVKNLQILGSKISYPEILM